MKRAVVIGSGAGGATTARELAGTYQVTLLEAGKVFKAFSMNLQLLEHLRSTNFFFSEKMIQMLFPAYGIAKTKDNLVLAYGIGLGGSTTLACGNAVRGDGGLAEIGINLDCEFEQLEKEIPVTCDHRHLWRETTFRLFDICERQGLKPFAVPKAGHYDNCKNCGHCTLGCKEGVKWDASVFVAEAKGKGARIVSGCRAKRIVIQNNRASGVKTNRGFFPADLVVVAAGGLNTPVILENSGVNTSDTLFVDPVLCVAAKYKDAYQNKEIPMPFAVQMDGYIISPYFDQLSFFFNKKWGLAGKDILSLMIKLADSEKGTPKTKALTEKDKQTLERGVAQCKGLLFQMGIKPENTFLGTLNGGHPGGMLPLTRNEAGNLHNPHLPENVYVADATLLPLSMGNPPMFTIMALAKRISRVILESNT